MRKDFDDESRQQKKKKRITTMKAVEWCAADAVASSSTTILMTSSSSSCKDDYVFDCGAQFLNEGSSPSFAENKLSGILRGVVGCLNYGRSIFI